MAEILDSIEDLHYSGTGSRKFVFTILTNFFRVLIYYKPTDLIPSVYILQNKYVNTINISLNSFVLK